MEDPKRKLEVAQDPKVSKEMKGRFLSDVWSRCKLKEDMMRTKLAEVDRAVLIALKQVAVGDVKLLVTRLKGHKCIDVIKVDNNEMGLRVQGMMSMVQGNTDVISYITRLLDKDEFGQNGLGVAGSAATNTIRQARLEEVAELAQSGPKSWARRHVSSRNRAQIHWGKLKLVAEKNLGGPAWLRTASQADKDLAAEHMERCDRPDLKRMEGEAVYQGEQCRKPRSKDAAKRKREREGAAGETAWREWHRAKNIYSTSRNQWHTGL